MPRKDRKLARSSPKNLHWICDALSITSSHLAHFHFYVIITQLKAINVEQFQIYVKIVCDIRINCIQP